MRPIRELVAVNAPFNGTDAGQSIKRRFSARITWSASRFAAAATYWLFAGGGAGPPFFENFALNHSVKTPETSSAMMNADVSRRFISLHPSYAT
jgi:hypothetical protein